MSSKVEHLVLNGISIKYKEGIISEPTPRCSYCNRGDYWHVLWPAGVGLSKFVTTRFYGATLQQLKVLDLGCGVGIGGLALAKMGAHVTFLDHVPDALDLVKKNCALNGIKLFDTLCYCWRNPSTLEKIGRRDMIVAADILYHLGDARWIGAFLRETLKPTGLAILGDPGRDGFNLLLRRLMKFGFKVSQKWVKIDRSREERIRILLAKPSVGSYSRT